MQASQLCQKTLKKTCPSMHVVRRQALQASVLAAMTGQHLTVTSIGRAIVSPAKEKHCIKRADRLLSNPHLQSERVAIYQALAQQIIGQQRQPLVLVDWSDCDPSRRHFLLRASTPVDGQSMTLYEEVHTVGSKEKPETHRLFLRRLNALLPEGCTPVIVTDAGFRTPWFRQVEALGWAWVGRVRNRTFIQDKCDSDWRPCKSTYAQASPRPKALGTVYMTRSNPIACQLVLVKAKPKGRVKLTCSGQRAIRHHSEKQAAREREPWLLATSLPVSSKQARKVVRIYATRMQIEEAFRGMKSQRYGLGFADNRTHDLERLQVLLLLATLAFFVLWLLGKAVELTQQHWHYQANTIRHRKVLSTFFVGLKVIDDPRVSLCLEDYERAFRCLSALIEGFKYENI